MNILVITGVIVSLALFVAAVLILLKSRRQTNDSSLMLMQQQLDSLRSQLSESLVSSTQAFHQQMGELTNRVSQNLQALSQQMLTSQQSVGERLDNASRVVGDVQKNLGTLAQATQRVFEVGKDIAGLHEILRAPKLRGGLGEFFLGDLLAQILPAANVEMQYQFRSGVIVDAVIRLGQNLVCVDAKFPLENFRRIIDGGSEEEKRAARRKFAGDVKKHVDGIAAKYILPDEGTFDFALMYIPAENVYYELIVKDDAQAEQSIGAYALAKKVIPVSPNSFYAYLLTIVLGLRGMKIEKNALETIQGLARLSADIRRFQEDFDIVGRHIVNLKNKYDDAAKKMSNFEGKLLSLCRAGEEQEKIPGDEQKIRSQ